MKSYTDINQSRKLAEILPLESADMSYRPYRAEGGIHDHEATLLPFRYASWIGVPCWSLTALLDVLPYPQLSIDKLGGDKVGWMVSVYPDNCRYDSCWHDDQIDACYEMIIELHEQKLL